MNLDRRRVVSYSSQEPELDLRADVFALSFVGQVEWHPLGAAWSRLRRLSSFLGVIDGIQMAAAAAWTAEFGLGSSSGCAFYLMPPRRCRKIQDARSRRGAERFQTHSQPS
jgi:hypothetical protein